MKLKVLSVAVLIASSLTFVLPAYSSNNYPYYIKTHWQSDKDLNFKNANAQQFGMVATLWPLLNTQEKIQEELIQLNEETKELIQALVDRDQITYGKRKICLDPNKCPRYSTLRQHLCLIRGDC